MIGSKAEKTTSQKLAAPVVFPVKLAKVFLFGRDSAATALTRKAGESNQQEVQEVKKEIEVESLMIQAESREITALEKNLEILKAQASLAGGYQFRSSMVKVPYVFIEDAITNAEKLVTPEQRQDLLIEKLSQKTQELEALKRELADVESAVAKLPADQQPPAPDSDLAGTVPTGSIADKEAARHEIEKIAEPLVKPAVPAALPVLEGKVGNPRLQKELSEIDHSLQQVIDEQVQLQDAEKKILGKRMIEMDSQLQKVRSKAMREDMLKERERMDMRISELTQQHDFLEKEKARFISQKV